MMSFFTLNFDIVLNSTFTSAGGDFLVATLPGLLDSWIVLYDSELFFQSFNPLFKTFRSCGHAPFISNFLILGDGTLCRPAYSDADLAAWDAGFKSLQDRGLVKEAANPILEPIMSTVSTPRPRVECPKESIINDDMIAWWKQEHEDMAMIYALDLSPEQVEANIQARIVAGDSPEMIESYRAHQTIRENMRPKHQEFWYVLQGMTLEEELALKRSTALGIASPMDPNWSGVHFSQDKPAKDVFTFAGKSVDLNGLTVEQADSIVEYLPGAEAERFKGMENVAAVYHKSIPTGKVSYPEPLVASASFTHNDIGFIHILQYQYWLWYIFIFLIIFFFLTFLCVVRWCNSRNRPRRETRGVSRSKCGDLITACVPVSWATSIIVSESTDAIDYFDGFSTGELVVGVRAYQWGWEYYYPKTVDLNYSVKPSYSTFVGNSIKYNGAGAKTLSSGHIWRHYQNKNTDVVNTPAHLLLLPLDNDRLLTFMNFNHVGSNTLDPSSAFKKIRTYSKVYTTNLVHTPTTFSDKYVNINSLYLDDWSSLGDSNWGVRRQHNLTSAQSLSDSYASSLDSGSFDRFVRHAFATAPAASGTELFTKNSLTPAHELSTSSDLSLVSAQSGLTGATPYVDTLSNVTRYPSVVLGFNNNSDAKPTNYPMRKLLNTKVWGSVFQTSNAVPGVFDMANISRLPRIESPFGESSGLLHSERAIRIQSGFSPNASHKNLSLGGNTLDSNIFSGSASRRFGTLDTYHTIRAAGSPDLAVFNRLASNRVLAGGSYPAVGSTNPTFVPLDYDHVVSTSLDVDSSASDITFNRNRNIPSEDMGTFIPLLKTSTTSDLPTLRTAYWRMFYSFANPTLRVDAGQSFNSAAPLFYLPLATNYAEYDFRNDQAAELLEEAFWETSYSAYSHYDYLQMANSETKGEEFADDNLIFEPMFYSNNFHDAVKLTPQGVYSVGGRPGTDSLVADVSVVGEYYANGIQFDDTITAAKLMTSHNFGLFPLSEGGNTQEDSYAELRDLVAASSQATNIFSLASTDYLVPRSYLSVLNSFRADFEDSAWVYDASENSSRVSNPFILRSTARNSIVTYNALQKVFRARMEEARANVQLADFANLGAKHPFIAAPATKYTSLLGKNRTSFFNVNYFAERSLPVFNEVSMLVKPLNIDFFDFPFLVAERSDMSRYFWLDWYANWGLIEVQPASYSKYSLVGVPFIRNSFDYSADEGDNNSATEGYFNKLSRARRNYLPNWQHTPWQTAQDLVWSSDERLLSLLAPRSGEGSSIMNMLTSMAWYNESLFFAKNTSEVFTPTSSGVGINTRPSWRPFASTQAYYYHMSQLSDLLTRREFLYRKYLESTSRLVSVPKTISAAPTNPLLREVKAAFSFIDPMTYNSEYSREFYYSSSEFVKFTLFKDLILKLSETASALPINHALINDYLFFYMFGSDNSSKLGRNEELYKNQYRPLRKGVSNMLRLHASGAIAMPIEIRLQILASSRDVIHSWAIPSAGIKIDCIPGYTSHRIMIFLISGIYWGQCMEICGRYHHWMPIVVYFMKRDLFFLWCTHFVFQANGSRQWEITDKQYADYVRFVSYDRSSWLSEVSREM